MKGRPLLAHGGEKPVITTAPVRRSPTRRTAQGYAYRRRFAPRVRSLVPCMGWWFIAKSSAEAILVRLPKVEPGDQAPWNRNEKCLLLGPLLLCPNFEHGSLRCRDFCWTFRW